MVNFNSISFEREIFIVKISEGDIALKKKSDLKYFFEPQSVAVIGSFKEGFFGGYVVVKTLLNAGFTGRIFPVNPSYKEVLGLKVYPSIKEIPEEIDLTLIIINCKAVPGVLRECAEKGVKAVIVVADGFAERDEEGAKLQKEILKIARQNGIRIIGPNTAGIANPIGGVLPNPYEIGYEKLKPGGIAICAQTGIINPQAFPYDDLHYGVSKICDFGNKSDVDECDMLEYLENDPATKVITMYLESIGDGRRFLEISRRVTLKKPVLILKSGRTKEGARVSASHTGSLAMDDQIFNAACKQAGIIRLENFLELFELPKIFAYQPLPKGNRLGMVTFTGGVGVLAIDEVAKYNLSIATLSRETATKLNAIFPGLGKAIVDIGPVMVLVNNYTEIYSKILKDILADDDIDCLFNVIWVGPSREYVEDYLKFYKELQGRCQKTIATWIYGPRIPFLNEMAYRLEDLGFPVFPNIEMAIKALGITCQYATTRREKSDEAASHNQ
jgi:acyl-CoA synthetase (NDP forming)